MAASTSPSNETDCSICSFNHDYIVFCSEFECFAIHGAGSETTWQGTIGAICATLGYSRLVEDLLAEVVRPYGEASGDGTAPMAGILNIETNGMLACEVHTGLYILSRRYIDYVYIGYELASQPFAPVVG